MAFHNSAKLRQQLPILGAISLLLLGSVAGCTMWTNQLGNPPAEFVDDVPLKIEADFPLQDDSQVLQEIRNLKMELRDDLGIPFSNDRIQVRIFQDQASFAQFTAQHFPQLNGRRALFVVEGETCHVYSVWSETILADLRHELTHAYLNSAVGTLPLWLDEGLAEYYEVVGTRGRLNREHLPWLADGLDRASWRPDLDRLASLTRPEQMTGVDYAESWLWIHFLMQNQRSPIIRDYLRAYRAGTPVKPLGELISSKIPQAEEKLVRHFKAAQSASATNQR